MSKYVICCLVLLLQSQIALGLDLNLFENTNRWGAFNRGINAFNLCFRVVESTGSYTGAWEFTGPEGGRVSCLAIDSQSDFMVVGAGQAGFYKSYEKGQSWEKLIIDEKWFNTMVARDVCFSGNRILASTDAGLFCSDDLGESWQILFNTFGAFNVIVDPLDSLTYYVGVYSDLFGLQGVWYTNDSGISWDCNNEGLSNADVVDLVFSPDKHDWLYACTMDGLYLNRNSGLVEWERVGDDLPAGPVTTLCIDPNNSDIMYVGLYTELYKSVNGGKNWQNINPEISNGTIIHNIIAMDDSILYVGTQNGLFKSKDGGTSWQTDHTGLNNCYVRTLLYVDEEIWLGTGEGLYTKSLKDSIWYRRTNGLNAMSINDFELISTDTGTVIYAGTLGAGMYFKADGSGWQDANVDSGFCRIEDLCVSNDNESFYQLSVTGYNQEYDDTLMPLFRYDIANKNFGTIYQFKEDLIGAPNTICECKESRMFMGTNNGMFVSYNGGEAWQSKSFDNLNIGVNRIVRIDNTLLLGTISNKETDPNGIYISQDMGENWQLAEGPFSQDVYLINEIEINPLDSNTVYAINMYQGIFKSKNRGVTWSRNDFDSDSLDTEPFTLCVNPVDTNIVVTAGTDVCISYDAGESWQLFKESLPPGSGMCYDAHFDPGDPDVLYIATSSNGLLCYKGVLTSVNEKDPAIPRRFGLKQNYPNPFNSSTMIEYELARNGNTQLVIYNMLGQKVRTLVNEYRSAGQYTQSWDGHDDNGQPVSAGLYVCRLIVNNQQTTIKLLYLP